MDRKNWYDERDDRTLRYAGRRLDHQRCVAISADAASLDRYDTQVSLLTLCNLLGRMTPAIALCFQDVPVHPALPWAGQSLHAVILAQMHAADPGGRFQVRDLATGDYQLHIGRNHGANLVHGTGWNAYIGPPPSPLLDAANDENCFGAAFAAVLAASQLFVHEFTPLAAYTGNALTWKNEATRSEAAYPAAAGNLLFVGLGSVGTAALYFLSLATRSFSPTLIDHDVVKRHNLDRSPLFAEVDVKAKTKKVASARDWLRAVGMRNVQIDNKPLHQSALWTQRQAGWPDVVIAAANEMKVRYHIEAGFPPMQIYGTTGSNWQAAGVRHEPFGDACSLCLFPKDAEPGTTGCASAPSQEDAPDEVDAALPFLSFAAGLMAAAETLKRLMPGFPFTTNRVLLQTRPRPVLVAARLGHRSGCFCETRNRDLHRRMLGVRD